MYRFLLALDDAIRGLLAPQEITQTAAAMLGRFLGVQRCAYAHVDQQQGTFTVTGDYVNGVPSIVGQYRSDNFGAAFVQLSEAGLPYVVNDTESDARVADVRDAYRQIAIRAVISVPVLKEGRFVAGMALHQNAPRMWQAQEIKLLELVASRCWESIERSRVTQASIESEAKFRTITNAMPQMVWSTLADGNHDYFNQQWYEYTGVPRGSTDGAGWNGIFHPDDQAHARERWAHSLATGETYEIQYRLRHHSGQYRWVLGRALPVHDEHGAIIRWMGTCTDIDAQKRAEVELREMNSRKDEFLAMLAHELRNPLAPIASAAYLLKLGKSDPARIEQVSDIITRQVHHMTALVDDLLDVSRVTRGQIELEQHPVDLNAMVISAIEQARPLIDLRQHHLHLDAGPAGLTVCGDRTRLVQVVANLLNNAAKYTSQGGQIGLVLASEGAHARITVTDNGSGIEPGLLPHIFDLFTQGARTPDRAQGGLGLGLTLVKSIVTLHGGTVTADSDGAGKGSRLTITLPLRGASQPVTAQAAPPVAQPVRPARLLIVDDNVDAAESLRALLVAQGHAVQVASEPHRALALALAEPPDIYILDIGLPDMDGYELSRRLHAQPGNAGAMFIALTGYGQGNDLVLSKKAGFDYHFIKPLDMQAFHAILAGRKER
ncbi:ATP-binding protein [Massilia sp. CF038]|uniref:ATP-binding protein n=1 Tax=Massilia sp. CF038 TaxID=1881045 RepID=UPI00091EF88E|nr:ATP-binding protein [Massilia sp. CF038]SHG54612.1 PAS domain S-box-containing protein [Massilia sp. CF038]